MLFSAEIIGRITHDLELKTTQSGKTVLEFSVAVHNRKKPDGSDDVGFMKCCAWDKAATTLNQFVKKGHLIYLSGDLNPNNYTNKDGVSVKEWKMEVNKFKFLPNKKEEGKEEDVNW